MSTETTPAIDRTSWEVAGNAPKWALDWAKTIELAPDEKIVAVYVVSPENLKKIMNQPLAYGVCPLLWPVMLIDLPFLAVAYPAKKKYYSSLAYAISNRRLYQKSVSLPQAGFLPETISDVPAGSSHGDVALAEILGMTADSTDLPGITWDPANCCPVEQVVLSLPIGHALATAGVEGALATAQSELKGQMHMYVDRPQEVVQLIQRLIQDTEVPEKIQEIPYAPPGFAPLAPPVVVAPYAPPVVVVQAAPMQPMQEGHVEHRHNFRVLKELFDSGAITQDEFEEKKAELLGRI